ncbi:hypothetical protein Hdeb2414_s0009g00307311 [Helianthus debilis subsp. tardiflorus]
MWAKAMGKLKGMEASNRERLWPQLVKGFNDLSERLKVSDINMSMLLLPQNRTMGIAYMVRHY